MSFQAYLDNIAAKTGKSADDLKTLAIGKGLADAKGLAPGVKATAIIDWLKRDFGALRRVGFRFLKGGDRLGGGVRAFDPRGIGIEARLPPLIGFLAALLLQIRKGRDLDLHRRTRHPLLNA